MTRIVTTLTQTFRTPLKSLATLTAAGLIAIAAVSAPTPADAKNGRNAALIFGGLALGIIAAGIASSQSPAYGYYNHPPVVVHQYRPLHCKWTTNWVWNGYQMVPVKQQVCW